VSVHECVLTYIRTVCGNRDATGLCRACVSYEPSSTLLPLLTVRMSKYVLGLGLDRTIAQAVSRWLHTTAALVRSRVWSSGICGGQSGAGVGLLEYFGFPCQSSFHQLLHNNPHLSSVAATIGQKRPRYKGLSPTPLAVKKNEINEV
jgi:hypothetical protein